MTRETTFGSRIGILFVLVLLLASLSLICFHGSQARADWIEDDPSYCGMRDSDPDDPNQSDGSETATPPPQTSEEPPGVLKVTPRFKMSFHEKAFTLPAYCSGGCSGQIVIQSYPNAKAAKKKGAKLQVFARASYSTDGVLDVPVANPTKVKASLRKLVTLTVKITPSGGTTTVYKIPLARG